MKSETVKLVILAAGKGTRMRRVVDDPELSDRQRRVAQTGVKALIPIDRPFLDYVLHRVAEAGFTDVCLVTGPAHDALRRYYRDLPCERLQISFALQSEPLGTAHAVAAAASFVGDDPFVVLNSDNCYPTAALRELRQLDGPAVVGFDRDALVANSNLTCERVARFALLHCDQEGVLRQIQEKPDPQRLAALAPPVLVGMNCWRFAASIFTSCSQIGMSSRGEYEIPDAVSHNMRVLGERFRVLPSDGPVLDLSSQSDVAGVAQRLAGECVQL